MSKFNKITIIGVGLIGGSIGLAVKKHKLAKVVCGVGRRQASLKNAKRIGAVDIATLDLALGVKDADLIVIATPISLIPQYALKIAVLSDWAKKQTIITDAGSTKEFVVSKLENILPKTAHFVGSHPFAGSEKTGALNASADLLKGALVFVTPSKKTNKAALNKVKRFWQAIGAKVVVMSAKKHDELIARISHMPHVLSAALVNSVSAKDAVFASTGFRDTTRIAKGDTVMWRDICLSNPDNILNSIDVFKKDLDLLAKAIKTKNVNLLMQQLESAKKKREAI
jgi:prephenate dehydrogenase